MPFLLEIFDFFKNQKNKIDEVLKKDFERKTFIFAIAYGITIWSQMLKTGGAGDNLGIVGLLVGILITGSLVGLAVFYFFSFILSKVIEMFGLKFNYKSCQKVYSWCLSPFLISAILVLIEFAIGGATIYTKDFITSANNSGFLASFISALTFINTFISIFFIVTFTKVLSYVLKTKWWKSLLFLFISAMITMLPLFLLKF